MVKLAASRAPLHSLFLLQRAKAMIFGFKKGDKRVDVICVIFSFALIKYIKGPLHGQGFCTMQQNEYSCCQWSTCQSEKPANELINILGDSCLIWPCFCPELLSFSTASRKSQFGQLKCQHLFFLQFYHFSETNVQESCLLC